VSVRRSTPARAAQHDEGGFFAAVHALVSAVPRGRVVTYGQVARLLGRARGARAVGWALRALHGSDTRVPWHRVLGQGGRISLGDRPSGLEQRRRLRAEGVRFAGGRVDLSRHAWDPAAAPASRARRTAQPRSGTSQAARARRRT
jgi:methylated-DNA-protein-cysteine methyltransferase-like protein